MDPRTDPRADPIDLAELATPRAAEARAAQAVLVLPIGAVEAHGPHLPLCTDDLLSKEMARRAVLSLRGRGLVAHRLPCISYSVAGYAASFAGTISIAPATATALCRDVCLSLLRSGFERIAIATAHLDPDHLASIQAAVDEVRAETGRGVTFPNLTRRKLAARLGAEFQTGACHAGRFESSLVLSIAPELVDDDVRRGLSAFPVSLSEGIRAGKRTFAELGSRDAYFGDPAAATADEGDVLYDTLAAILVEAVLADSVTCG